MITPEIVVDRSERGIAVLTLRGEHEGYTTPKLRGELSLLLDDGLDVIVDLREATFLDSTSVGVFLTGREEAQERGLAFVLLMNDSTGWSVRRLFEITGLASVLPVASTREEALAAARDQHAATAPQS